MIKWFLSFLLCITSLVGHTQLSFKEAYNIKGLKNGQLIPNPYTGGFNNAQFGEIDLNMDGIQDLVIYDRFRGFVKPYINNGIPDSVSYTYAPELSYRFPEMDQFLLTRDYNNDGKFDLFVGGSSITVYKNTSTRSNGLSFEYVGELKSKYQSFSQNRLGVNPTGTNIPGIYDIDNDNDLDLFIRQGSSSIDYHRNFSMDDSNNYDFLYERRSTCWGQFLEGANKSRTRFDSIYLNTCETGNPGELNGSGKQSVDEKLKGLKHGEGLTITALDYDNNGSTDLILSDDGSYRSKLVLNADSGQAPFIDSRIFAYDESFPSDDVPINLLFAAVYLVDVNNDGKKDMLAASNRYNIGLPPFSEDDIWYYKNISTDDSYEFEFLNKTIFQDKTFDFGRTSKPVFYDYDGDGLMDLLIGNGGYLSPVSDSIFIPQLALLKNIGSKNKAEFNLVDNNFLNIPALDFGFNYDELASLSPALGDLDNDGDQDLLLTQGNGKLYLFEDTSAAGVLPGFKFSGKPFQGIGDTEFRAKSAVFYDLDSNGLLDLIVNSNNEVKFYKNLGSPTIPVYQIALDSFLWVGGDTVRYHFSQFINLSNFKIGDSLAVSNANKPDNQSNILLILTKIDSLNQYLECKNTLWSGNSGSPVYDEISTSAHLGFYKRNWSFFRNDNYFRIENTFFFRDKGKNQLLIGATNGNNYFAQDFTDKFVPLDTIPRVARDITPNFGSNSFIHGTDLNNDGFIDLAIGLNTGGIKLVYGGNFVGLPETKDFEAKNTSFFKLFPNPGSSYVNILITQEAINSSYDLEIRNISGQLILKNSFSERRSSLNLSELPDGLYFVQLRSDRLQQTEKLIIRR